MKKILLTALAALALTLPASAAKTEKADFAGGCFWCMQSPFDKLKGVISVTAGYTGGHTEKPTYEEVSSGSTGHAESIEIVYDPALISYGKLLAVYWHNVDPFAVDRQFCDEGSQYRTAIFYSSEAQRKAAEASKAELAARFKRPIATQVVPASAFYPAEGYHQCYYQTNSLRYKLYRSGCGRDRRLHEIWGDEAGH